MGQPEVYIHFTDGMIDDQGNVANKQTRAFLKTITDRYAYLELLHLRNSLESDLAGLIGGRSTVDNRTFAKLRVHFINGHHQPSVARLVEQVRLMGLLGEPAPRAQRRRVRASGRALRAIYPADT